MEFRTTFNIAPSSNKIGYKDSVMFLGSCFSISIGNKFLTGHMKGMANPFGTVYNPISINTTLDSIITRKKYSKEDLYNHNGTWLSFDHYTNFTGPDPGNVVDKINSVSKEAYEFIRSAGFLFVTFGTARVYRWMESGKIVSNCHKLPAAGFTHELVPFDEIVLAWSRQLDNLQLHFPSLKVILTISPIRHWKDGAHENQVSKSVLFLAVEELLKHPSQPGYFPAYEIIMDDLRDYRFYEEDMLHLNQSAINYIWDAFTNCYFDAKTLELWKEVVRITKALEHRIKNDSHEQITRFSEKILRQIESINLKAPEIDLESERKYFTDLKNKTG
jgi:hypothetical protein